MQSFSIFFFFSVFCYHLESKNLSAVAEPIKARQVFIVAVGLGKIPREEELQSIVSDPEALFLIRDLNEVSTYVDPIAKVICEGELIQFCKSSC